MRFDIILPTINRDSLSNAVQSVLQQNYHNWELHIVGDGLCLSDIGHFYEMDGRIHVSIILPKRNDFGADARNAGIDMGHNPWIAYIDDDDVWLPDHLTILESMRMASPEANMLRTAGRSFMWKHKSPRSSKLIRKLGALNDADVLTVGMAHTRELFCRTAGWQPCDNHDLLLWQEMLTKGGNPIVNKTETFQFER